MPAKSQDLHGNVPDKAKVALLLIDVISDFEVEDSEELFKNTLPIARNLSILKERAKKERVPVIYVNDNFGKWRSDFKKLPEHCLKDDVRGRPIVELLLPDDEDYFVLKPKHSGFFSTTPDVLLTYLQVNTLILTGITTDICVLFTANDAYMRDYNLCVLKDCVASVKLEENEHALKHIKRVLKADTRLSNEIDFNAFN